MVALGLGKLGGGGICAEQHAFLLVHDWRGFHEYYRMGQKIDCLKKNANLSVSPIMFCKQFIAYREHIDRSAFLGMQSINIDVGLNIYL